jgi:phospholipase/carboxylesterase
VTASEAIVELAGLETVAVGDRATARMILVFVHGFGMTPADLTPFAHSLGLPAWCLFPTGPLAASIGGRAWWHIDAVLREQALARGPRDFAEQDPPDLGQASSLLEGFIDEASRIAGDRPVFVAGFSQGGMLTCHTLLRAPRRLAGVMLLSASRLAFSQWEPRLRAGALKGTPMLVSHGEHDADLAFSAGVALKDCLLAGGADVTWVPFEGGHEIPLLVWRRLRRFVMATLAARHAEGH